MDAQYVTESLRPDRFMVVVHFAHPVIPHRGHLSTPSSFPPCATLALVRIGENQIEWPAILKDNKFKLVQTIFELRKLEVLVQKQKERLGAAEVLPQARS
jgi:hypothetical protein